MPTRRTTVPEELPRPELRISHGEAEQKLQKRLDIGEELLARSLNSETDVDNAWAAVERWHDFNRELLGTMFTNEKFANDYAHNSHGAMVMASSIWDERNNFSNDVRAKLSSLTSVKDRLELITESSGEPVSSRHAEPVRSGRYTLNVSGGTVVLGDGAQVKNVTVGDIVSVLEKEIKGLPDSPEKTAALSGLRSILANETFANVTGAAVGSFLSHLLK